MLSRFAGIIANLLRCSKILDGNEKGGRKGGSDAERNLLSMVSSRASIYCVITLGNVRNLRRN